MDIWAGLLMAVCGFFWGNWFGEWNTKRNSWKTDAGLILLCKMSGQLIDKAKFVTPNCQLKTSHTIHVKDREFTLSLALEPQLID